MLFETKYAVNVDLERLEGNESRQEKDIGFFLTFLGNHNTVFVNTIHISYLNYIFTK